MISSLLSEIPNEELRKKIAKRGISGKGSLSGKWSDS
jgi:hypothetical protein